MKSFESQLKHNYDFNHARKALNHSIRRAHQRYSIKLSELDIFKMSDMVVSGKGILKRKQFNRSIYKLNYLGKNFVIVFDYVLMLVVTFLPHRSLRNMCNAHEAYFLNLEDGGSYVQFQ